MIESSYYFYTLIILLRNHKVIYGKQKIKLWVENLTSRSATVDPMVDPIIGWLGRHFWSLLRSLTTLVHWQIRSSQRPVSHKSSFYPVNHFLRGHYLLFQMFVQLPLLSSLNSKDFTVIKKTQSLLSSQTCNYWCNSTC